MDDITTAILAANIAGVTRGAGTVGSELVVTTYNGLKTALAARGAAGGAILAAVAAVEQAPRNPDAQQALTGALTQAELDADDDLGALAEALKDALALTQPGHEALEMYELEAAQTDVSEDEGDLAAGEARLEDPVIE